MSFNHFSRSVICCIGLGWGLLSGFIVSRNSAIQEREREVHDRVMMLRRSPEVPREILLVQPNLGQGDDPETFVHPEDLQLDQFNQVVERLVPALIEQYNVQLIVLNAPAQWPSDRSVQPPPFESGFSATSPGGNQSTAETIRQQIKTYQQNLVFITSVPPQPRDSRGRKQRSEIVNYSPVLPFRFSKEDNVLQPILAPEEIQGFWEKKPLPEMWRSAPLARQFSVKQSGENQIFRSMALLTCQKLSINSVQGSKSCPQPNRIPGWMFKSIWIPFLGKSGTFSSLDLTLPAKCRSQQCDQEALDKLGDLTGKIILIDLSEAFVETPLGRMSTQEVQANLLASLLQQSFAQEVIELQPALSYGLIIVVALLIDIAIIWRIEIQGRRLLYAFWISVPLFWFGYGIIYALAGWLGFLLPMIWPIFTWTGTVIATTICALFWQRELQFNQQVRELEQLRGETEEKALVLKTQTLLRRIACDIHGGPLQELRAAMFQIENLKRSHPQIEVVPIVNALVEIGQNIRGQLNNVQDITAKLKITPQLRKGLDVGIHHHLQRMTEVGRLQLKVNQAIQPLTEPDLNMLWIAAREDIFRWFCEAINNVVYHAQPPRGNATQVTVSLSQTGEHCQLAITNNGSTPLILNDTDPKSSGQGTKAMIEIARDLPDGTWRRFPLVEGGLCVELCWSMQFQMEGSVSSQDMIYE